MCDWQPMETAPKDGTRIILASPDGNVWCNCHWQKMMRVPDRWESFDRQESFTKIVVPFDPVAWMPTPMYPILENQ